MDGHESTTLDVKPDAPDSDIEDQRLRAVLGARLFGRREQARIDRFRLVGRLGSGGMGIVYDAWDPKLRRRVALKVVRPDRGDQGQDRRLLKEARAAAQLKHPNVVTIYEVGEMDDLVWIAMEFIEGTTIAGWLETERRAWRDVVELYMAAGRGLAEAHRRGLIHRDFKPDNVLVESTSEGPVPRVVDFGLARKSQGDADPDGDAGQSIPDLKTSISDEDETAAGRVMGTPAYMAPEQMAGLEIDARVDQFAFCVSLYESLEGTRPFAGTTLCEVLIRIEEGQVRRPRRRLPRWLVAILQRGLAYDPGARYGSMAELLAALESGLGRRRHVSVGLAALGIAAVVAGVFAWPQPDQCLDAAAEARRVWSPARRGAAQEWFLGADSSAAAASSEAFVNNVDEWIRRWSSMRLDACRASELQQRQSAELRDRRDACLDQRLRQVAGLVRQLDAAEASPEAMARAVTASSQLPELDLCANTTWLLEATAFEGSPDERRRLAALELEVAELEGAVRTASPGELTRAASEARERAQALGHTPLVARALLVEARTQTVAGDREAAYDGLGKAFRTAIRASADDTAAEAALGAAWVQIEHHDDLDDAQRWLGDADAFIESLNEPVRLRARWLDHSGVLALIQGDLARAIELHREALAIRDATPGLEFVAAQTRVNLAGALAQAGEVEEAIEMFAEARMKLAAMVGDSHPVLAQFATNESVALHRAGRYADAEAAARRALEIKAEVFGDDDHRLASSLVGLANAVWEQGRREEANELLSQAIALREAELGPDHPRLAIPLNNLGAGEFAVGRPEVALGHFARAHAIATAHYDADHPDVIYSAQGWAECLEAVGRPSEAGALLDPVIDAIDAKAQPVLAAQALVDRARLHRRSGDGSAAKADALIDRARGICAREGVDCGFSIDERLAPEAKASP